MILTKTHPNHHNNHIEIKLKFNYIVSLQTTQSLINNILLLNNHLIKLLEYHTIHKIIIINCNTI